MPRAEAATIRTIWLLFLGFFQWNVISPMLERGIISSPDDGRKPSVRGAGFLKKIFPITPGNFGREPFSAYGTDTQGVSYMLNQESAPAKPDGSENWRCPTRNDEW
jgi:hypothetical protein